MRIQQPMAACKLQQIHTKLNPQFINLTTQSITFNYRANNTIAVSLECLKKCLTNNNFESTFPVEDFLFFFSVLTPHVQPCCFTSEVVLPSWWGSLERLAFFLVTISVLAISDCLLSFFAILLELSFCSYTDTAAGILGFPSESLSLFSSLICADDSGKSLGEPLMILSLTEAMC